MVRSHGAVGKRELSQHGCLPDGLLAIDLEEVFPNRVDAQRQKYMV